MSDTAAAPWPEIDADAGQMIALLDALIAQGRRLSDRLRLADRSELDDGFRAEVSQAESNALHTVIDLNSARAALVQVRASVGCVAAEMEPV